MKTMKPHLLYRDERGAALVISLMFLVILGLLGTTAVVMTTTDIKIGSNYSASQKAFYNADAGVNFAFSKMKAGLKASPQTFGLPTAVGGSPSPPLTYTVPTGFSFSISNITMIASKVYSFTSTGSGPDNAQAVIVATFSTAGVFNYGIFGDLGVILSGNGRTDSYDSSVGPYTWATHNTEGDVGTNAVSAGAIRLSGNAKVYGDTTVGPGGNPASCVTTSGNAEVVPPGQKLVADETKDLTPISDPGGGTTLAAWILSANTNYTMPAGTYRLPSIGISGNATGTISGDVTLHVTGNLSISGNGKLIIPAGSSLKIYASGTVSISGNGISNNTGFPKNLQIYGTSTCSSLSISGNGNLYGAIYAPVAAVSVTGNGDIYGSAIGRTINISGNGNLHYDEDLQSVGPCSDLKLLSWQEKR